MLAKALSCLGVCSLPCNRNVLPGLVPDTTNGVTGVQL